MKTTFSAGLDLKELYQPDQQRLRTMWTTLVSVWEKLYGSAYPTAAAVNVMHRPFAGVESLFSFIDFSPLHRRVMLWPVAAC